MCWTRLLPNVVSEIEVFLIGCSVHRSFAEDKITFERGYRSTRGFTAGLNLPLHCGKFLREDGKDYQNATKEHDDFSSNLLPLTTPHHYPSLPARLQTLLLR